MRALAFAVSCLLLSHLLEASAEQCGRQAGGALCPGGLCCSKFGWCGNTPDYCGADCQSQCSAGKDLSSIISRSTFDQMLKHRNDGGCSAKGFYTYDAFISAAKAFPSFGNTGDVAVRKREIAAFFAQTSHETTGLIGLISCFFLDDYNWKLNSQSQLRNMSWWFIAGGWATAPDGPYAWGYCFLKEQNPGSYCSPSPTYPCAPGKQYYGRGPIQLSW